MSTSDIILVIHIVSGLTVLVAGLIALLSAPMNLQAHIHCRMGKIFIVSSFTLLVTSIPITISSNNESLLLIAYTSFNLSIAGLKCERSQPSNPHLSGRHSRALHRSLAASIVFVSTYQISDDVLSNLMIACISILSIILTTTEVGEKRESRKTREPPNRKHFILMISSYLFYAITFLSLANETITNAHLTIVITAISTALIFYIPSLRHFKITSYERNQ